MSVTISGDTGLAGAATGALNGSLGATTPSTVVATDLTTTGNTILGNASTDTLNVGNGDLIKDASGNVGIGVTPKTWSQGKVIELGTSGVGLWQIDSGSFATIQNTYYNTGWKYASTAPATYYVQTSGQHQWFNAPSGTINTPATFTQAMTLDASGNLGIGIAPQAGYRTAISSATAAINAIFAENTHTSFAGDVVDINASRNATAGEYNFLVCSISGVGVKLKVLNSGNVQNANNSYGAISDIKLKENIVDTSPKLDKLLQVKIRNYNLKTDPDHKQIGVIAQELETVFPSLIEETEDKETVTKTREVDGVEEEYTEQVPTGETTKAVKYSVFVPILVKAIQEQQALITSLTARLELLEAK
jgi:hypothetical protein